MKSGIVTIMGRPNVGKSTLLNALMGRKVTITSPKPQTTRFPLQAVFEDERGQIIFTDTPGVFMRADDPLSQSINTNTEHTLGQKTDVVVYLIDPTREKDVEENKSLGMVRRIDAPKILVINKADKEQPYKADFAFYEDEFDAVINISALKHSNLNTLLDKIFEFLPEGEKIIDITGMPMPVLNMDSKLFVAEIIREKVFLMTREELPYTVKTKVEDITERDSGTLYIKADIITTDDRYKQMLIGKGGSTVKEIGTMARKELETATGKKIFLDLNVEVDPHWQMSL